MENHGSTARSVEIEVKAQLQASGRSEKRPDLTAFVFSQGGRLLGHQRLDTEGGGKVKIAAAGGATSVRVLIGPANEARKADLADLLRVGAVETHLRIDEASERVSADFHLISAVWLAWLEGLCCVRGTLEKGYSNGVQLPVCGALVEIYEVEPWWILVPRIPIDVLGKLRQVVAGSLVPLPHPDPGPVELPVASLAQAAVSTRPAVTAPAAKVDYGALTGVALNAGDFEFRQSLLAHEWLIRPLLCWLWPRFVTLHLVGTVPTDQCGHFQFCFFKGFGNTGPTNLYFRAKTRFLPSILPSEYIYIYDPEPVGCHTWWNYQCGSSVTLVTTSPWAYACPPCFPVIAPDNWVLFTAIGNTSLSTIRGSGQSLVGTTDTANLGLSEGGGPWGATLRPRLDFDDSLRLVLGVKYYRVSWRRGTSGTPNPIVSGDIYRHYIWTPGGSSTPVITPYFLGPQTVGASIGLFEIPPAVPPQGQWTVVDAVADTASALFATDIAGVAPGVTYDGNGNPVGSDQSGLFELQVDLFDAAGNAVDIAALGIQYVVPTSADLTTTITTADASTITEPGGGTLVSGNSMVVPLFVNNNRCRAAIDAPTINASAADDCCGVLRYQPGDQVGLSWDAVQAGGFATYGFTLYRGANSVWSQSGAVGGGSFSTLQSVATLMGPNASCGETCTLAGFSQNLGVYAAATDGWSRLSGYDAYAVWAFVLAAA